MGLFKTFKTEIAIEKNMKVDDLNLYLNSLTPIYSEANFQYLKLDLDLDVKINIAQDYVADSFIGNYASLEQDSKIYYFFITKPKWISPTCVGLHLVMDTVNTFWNQLTFDQDTKVIRTHKARCLSTDRVVYSSNPEAVWGMNYVVDPVSEGIDGAPKYKTGSDTVVTDSVVKANQLWYLVYKSKVASTASKPIDVFLYPKNMDTPHDDGYSATITITPDDFPDMSTYFYIFDYNGENMFLRRYSSTQLSKGNFSFGSDNIINRGVTDYISSFTFDIHCFIYTSVNNDVTLQELLASTPTEIKAGVAGTAYLDSINAVDRSDPTILKIIELPYCPANITWTGNVINLTNTGFEIKNNSLHLINYTSEFERNLPDRIITEFTSVSIAPALSEESYSGYLRIKALEPKVYHSSFFSYKINYDSFNTTLDLERVTRGALTPKFSTTFKPTNALTSEMLFKFSFTNVTKYRQIADYEEFLLANRNNELGLYTSQYLEYLRVGYNFDVKQKNRETLMNIGSTVLNLVGTVASLAAAVPTGGLSVVAGIGFATSTINSLGRTISQTLASEQSLDQKLKEYERQAAQVRNANAIDLLNKYNGNKLRIMKYQVSDNMLSILRDLFYYCGYADDTQHVPDVNSRYWFNYIQCEACFYPAPGVNENFLADIINRLKAGVTVYHRHFNSYDFEQKKENWEVFLFDE